MPPSVTSIALANITVFPPTWTFSLFGSGFVPGATVLWTPPGLSTTTLHDADILSVTGTLVRVVTTEPLVSAVGDYTVAVRNPDATTSPTLTFTMTRPGMIVAPAVGYMHIYGYAFIRPPTPNTTHAPLGLAPGATVTIYELGTTTPVALYLDQAGTTTGNPTVADGDAFYSVYFVPQPVDIQFSGGGIPTPYTIGDAVPLDPRIPALEAAVAALEAP